ncbi:MAG: oligopeptide transporter, OPT family [Calditrichaeota bacterium]|nr:MAG: oligopeptide transporter, OPT family [Calditrichota bacterium]
MSDPTFKPYVPADSDLKEFTFKALFLGVIMAVVLGAANAYLGMKAGLTVAATFPAAVVAMAALRGFKGTILEENVARTTASVGEALVAGAIFTIPAFVISGVWDSLFTLEHLVEGGLIMLIGGTLGVLFIILLRRTMVEEANLPFPESVAAAEIVKAGQGGATGAQYVFGAMGLAGLLELFKNSNGIHIIQDTVSRFFTFAQSKIELLGAPKSFSGGMKLESPSASPALVGVGYIVGFNISAVLFAGAVLGHLLLVPLALFLNPGLKDLLGPSHSWLDISDEVWLREIRPLAVGTMIVAAFYTLYNLRTSLMQGLTKAFKDLQKLKEHAGPVSRLEIDLDFKKVIIAILVLAVPQYILYHYFSGSLLGSILLTVVLLIVGFLFAAVAGYLVGLIGSSNNPISGLTLSTLLISAILMVAIGVTGVKGVAAVLGVAGVVCCAAGIAGDMTQDLKVGHILGGTPWRMQMGEIIGVVVAGAVLMPVIALLDNVYKIGSAQLPAPQAGLMALMAKGIVGGEMAWPLVIVGIFFAVGLILIKAPSPMLIAVGMYLPFSSTAAIFVGGIFKWIMDRQMAKQNLTDEQKTKAENTGVLLASGLIAGESLMAVILALVVAVVSLTGSTFSLASLSPGSSAWLGLIIFAILFYVLILVPKASTSKK